MSYLLCLFLGLFYYQPPVDETLRLTVVVKNIRHAQGKIWFAVKRPQDDFRADRPEIYQVSDVKSTADCIVYFDLPPGEYAVAIYHDVNNNQKLDKNFLGIPKEPYGFSNNFRPRFAPPKFEDCAFDLSSTKTLIVNLTD